MWKMTHEFIRYKTVEGSSGSATVTPPKSWSVEDLRPWLLEHAASVNEGKPIDPEKDLFQQGFDRRVQIKDIIATLWLILLQSELHVLPKSHHKWASGGRKDRSHRRCFAKLCLRPFFDSSPGYGNSCSRRPIVGSQWCTFVSSTGDRGNGRTVL